MHCAICAEDVSHRLTLQGQLFGAAERLFRFQRIPHSIVVMDAALTAGNPEIPISVQPDLGPQGDSLAGEIIPLWWGFTLFISALTGSDSDPSALHLEYG